MIKHNVITNLQFTDTPQNFIGKDYLSIEIPSNISTKKKLLNILEEKFRFPYFGRNWDALWDLLNDFHWIKEKNISIIHSDIPLRQNPNELDTYLEILNDVSEVWKKRTEHKFIVTFPKNTKEIIKKLTKE